VISCETLSDAIGAADLIFSTATAADLGLPNGMSAATVGWRRLIAGSGIAMPDTGAEFHAFADALL